MKIDWSRVDWFDCAVHGVVALLIVVLGAYAFGLPWTFASGAIAIFYVRECWQHSHSRLPWQWSWGAQMELYVPIITSLVTAISFYLARS